MWFYTVCCFLWQKIAQKVTKNNQKERKGKEKKVKRKQKW